MGNCACIQNDYLKKKDYQINLKSIRNVPSKNFYDIKGSGIKDSLVGTTVISNHKHLNNLNNISNELTNSFINNLGIINHQSSKKSNFQNSHIIIPEIQNSYSQNNNKNQNLLKVNNIQNFKINQIHDSIKTSFYWKKREKYDSGKIIKLQNGEITPKVSSINYPEIIIPDKEQSIVSKSFSNTDLRKPILSKLYKHNKKNKITNLE